MARKDEIIEDEDEEIIEDEDELEEEVFSPEPDVEDEPEPLPAPEPYSGADDDMEEEESILTGRAEDAALGAFKKLAARTAIDRISGITIEEIVRDELRPMLRAWLDQNLPPLVERLLREELDRVARRALEE